MRAGRAVGAGAGLPQRLGGRPAVGDRDGAAHLRGHRRVVRHDEDGHAEVGVRLLQGAEHVPGGDAVELAGRLVGEQQLRVVRQRGGDRGPLLLAARHLVGLAIRAVPHAEYAEQLVGPAPALTASGPGEAHRQHDVLPGGQVRKQVARGLLPDEADDPAPVADALPGCQTGQVVPGHADRAGGRRVEAGQDVHQRRLAAPGRANHRRQLPFRDQQVKALQCLHLDAVPGKDPDQSVAGDERALTIGSPGAHRFLGELADRPRRLAHRRCLLVLLVLVVIRRLAALGRCRAAWWRRTARRASGSTTPAGRPPGRAGRRRRRAWRPAPPSR